MLKGYANMSRYALGAANENSIQGLLELERLLKGLIDIESEMQINENVLQNLGQEVASGTEIVSNSIELSPYTHSETVC